MKANIVRQGEELAWLRSKSTLAENGCWEVAAKRYGQLSFNGLKMKGNRAAWFLARGPIPNGMYVCHRCNNKRCINPDHLYLGTHLQNVRDAWRDGIASPPPRGVGPAVTNAAKTHCVHGHPFAGENLLIDSKGYRKCKTCQRGYLAKHRAIHPRTASKN